MASAAPANKTKTKEATAMATKIEWCDETWNPIVGCEKISEGCQNCYAEKMAVRLAAMGTEATDHYLEAVANGRWSGKTAANINQAQLWKWKRRRLIFVCSMGDLFHQSVPDEMLDKVFGIMALNPKHWFLVLTKRAERMRDYFLGLQNDPAQALRFGYQNDVLRSWTMPMAARLRRGNPIPNIWLGVTAENQRRADERVPLLLETPAAGRFVSVEPMLGQVDLDAVEDDPRNRVIHSLLGGFVDNYGIHQNAIPKIDWVICGGESGPGARELAPPWVRELRNQCQAAETPFFFKQWGGPKAHHPHERLLDGEEWMQIPAALKGGA
jgi:protein gp37